MFRPTPILYRWDPRKVIHFPSGSLLARRLASVPVGVCSRALHDTMQDIVDPTVRSAGLSSLLPLYIGGVVGNRQQRPLSGAASGRSWHADVVRSIKVRPRMDRIGVGKSLGRERSKGRFGGSVSLYQCLQVLTIISSSMIITHINILSIARHTSIWTTSLTALEHGKPIVQSKPNCGMPSIFRSSSQTIGKVYRTERRCSNGGWGSVQGRHTP